MVERVPLEADEAGLQVELLHQRVGHGAVGGASVGAQVAAHSVVDGEESGAGRRDFECVEVRLVAVTGAHDREVFVGAVGDHDPRVAPARGDERILPPREDRPAAVFLQAQVRRTLARRDRLEPEELAGVVEDHRPVLPRPRVGREEHVAGRLRARVRGDRDGGRLEIRARDEVLEVARVRPRRRAGRGLERATRGVHGRDREAPRERRGARAPAQERMHGHDLPLGERLGGQEAGAVPLGVGG